MSVKRSRPASPAVRKSARVGPEYPEALYRNPVNADVEHEYNMGDDARTLESPNEETVTGAGLPLHKKKYDGYWEGN